MPFVKGIEQHFQLLKLLLVHHCLPHLVIIIRRFQLAKYPLHEIRIRSVVLLQRVMGSASVVFYDRFCILISIKVPVIFIEYAAAIFFFLCLILPYKRDKTVKTLFFIHFVLFLRTHQIFGEKVFCSTVSKSTFLLIFPFIQSILLFCSRRCGMH